MRCRWFTATYLTALLLLFGAAIAINDAVYEVTSADMKEGYIIVIDAGHGGEDGGAVSCSGAYESHINLSIALRMEDLLHLLGYPTVMVRREDTDLHTEGTTIAQRKRSDLMNRVTLIRETPNAFLVSIHQNKFSEPQYWGAQVFYGKEERGRRLASALQASLITEVNPGSRRKEKPANDVFLMRQIRCPGILVECGFLSNPEEERLLQTDSYQKKLSCVIAGNIGLFLTAEE